MINKIYRLLLQDPPLFIKIIDLIGFVFLIYLIWRRIFK
jgi:hypothetical protein